MTNYSIAVLPGDGIGPEVVAEGVRILDAVGSKYGHNFNVSYGTIGGGAIDQCGSALPADTLALCVRSDAVLLGAVGGPKWEGSSANARPEDGLLAIRKELGLFANLRPIRIHAQLINASPIKAKVLEGVDMVIVRELTGGLYFGRPKRRWETSRGRRGVDTMTYTEQEIRRILRVGFQLAQSRQNHLTSVDKANVLETSRLWRQIAVELSHDFPEVTLEHMLVDTAAMQLIRQPARFDVIVTENTFGDILTDEASMLSGSLGMLPSASLAVGSSKKGPDPKPLGMYEPIHGSAPDIAGKGLANPIGTILSVAMMLRLSLGLEDEARTVEEAVDEALGEGYRTQDIISSDSGVVVSTKEMGTKVAKALCSGS